MLNIRKYAVLGVALTLFMGTGYAKSEDFQISKTNTLFKKLSYKYKTELNLLESGRRSSEIKEEIIVCAEDYRFDKKKSGFKKVMLALFEPVGFESKSTPLTKYGKNLRYDTNKLKGKEKALACLRHNEEAQAVVLKLTPLRENLKRINTIVKSSREYRAERRYANQVLETQRTREMVRQNMNSR